MRPSALSGARPVICLVTDRRRLAELLGLQGDSENTLDALRSLVDAGARGGVDLVQLREPDLDGERLCRLAAELAGATASHGARLVVNDRLDVALAAGADGVHLKESSFDPKRVRAVTPEAFVIGWSVHGVDRLIGGGAQAEAVDYLTFGPIYPTRSKPGATPAGVSGLGAVVAAAAAPVLAIGGVTVARAPEIAATGAAGIAAIDLFIHAFASQSVHRTVADLRRAFDSAETVP